MLYKFLSDAIIENTQGRIARGARFHNPNRCGWKPAIGNRSLKMTAYFGAIAAFTAALAILPSRRAPN
jgi:hypothetical protein